MTICINCKKQTKNPKFCSKSCAATYNNSKFPKRKPENRCIDCNKLITCERKRCEEHYLIWQENKKAKDLTLKDAIYEKHHRSSAFALIRSRARQVAKKIKIDKECQICGYNKHVEIAHINPISSFSESVLISEINSPDNLAALCPNCHWEFDHNLTQLK
jgi:hypothetical protein